MNSDPRTENPVVRPFLVKFEEHLEAYKQHFRDIQGTPSTVEMSTELNGFHEFVVKREERLGPE